MFPEQNDAQTYTVRYIRNLLSRLPEDEAVKLCRQASGNTPLKTIQCANDEAAMTRTRKPKTGKIRSNQTIRNQDFKDDADSSSNASVIFEGYTRTNAKSPGLVLSFDQASAC